MSRRRLPSQPTNTRLARAVDVALHFVGRNLHFVGRNLRFVRRGRHEDLQRGHSRLLAQYNLLHQSHQELRRDYAKFLAPMRSCVGGANYSFDELGPTPLHTTEVFFEPLKYSTYEPRFVRRDELEAHTVEVLRDHANAIARRHADELAEQILRATVPRAIERGRQR